MMLLKIDVRDIIADHFRTLVDYRTKRSSFGDIVLFYVVPLLVTGLLLWRGVTLSDGAVNVIITALSIFAGLLFNLLLLMHGIIKRSDAPARAAEERKLIREIYSNVSYSILVSILALAALLITIGTKHTYVILLVSALTYFLVGNFLLTLLMVLKRVHVLLSHEFSRPGTAEHPAGSTPGRAA